jgi:predicted molibdopterin-dependent oxidoreductase YjgC
MTFFIIRRIAMYIEDHPILGKMPERKVLRIEVEGKTIEAYEGEPIAAALAANGINVFRYTRKLKEPRGISCALGQCTDCIMIVNGIPNTRTCVTRVEEGMKIQRQK